MRVKLLLSLGSNDFPDHPFKQDETHEVSEPLGKKLVARKLAVEVIEPAAPPKAQPQAALDAAEPQNKTKSAAAK